MEKTVTREKRQKTREKTVPRKRQKGKKNETNKKNNSNSRDKRRMRQIATATQDINTEDTEIEKRQRIE